MGGLRTLATLAAGAGMFIIVADRMGWLPSGLPYRAQLIGAGTVALLIYGSFLLVADAWTWFRQRFPTRERRLEVAAEAVRLGMRSLERGATSLDRSLPLLQTPTRDPLLTVMGRSFAILVLIGLAFWLAIGFFAGFERQSTDAQRVMIVGPVVVAAGVILLTIDIRRSRRPRYGPGWFAAHASRPRAAGFDWIFAGRWRGTDVRVFDYWSVLGGLRHEWTCVLMPTDLTGWELELNRTPVGEASERPFHVLTEADDRAQRILTAEVQSLLGDDDAWDLIQLGGRRLLYCARRMPLEAREELLKSADGLRGSLSASRVDAS